MTTPFHQPNRAPEEDKAVTPASDVMRMFHDSLRHLFYPLRMMNSSVPACRLCIGSPSDGQNFA